MSDLYISPENVKGIQRNPDQLNSVLFGALSYIRSSWSDPKENAMISLDKAKIMTEKSSKSVTTFITGDWKAYQEKVAKLNVKIFKE